MNDQTSSGIGEGYIVVRVSTARGAIPLAGAEVIVRQNELENSTDILASMLSSNSGLTARIALPAPSRKLSESPGNAKPFATYNIEVRADGYFTQNYNEVAVFDGITSYQNAILIPLPDNAKTDNYTFDERDGVDVLPPLL